MDDELDMSVFGSEDQDFEFNYDYTPDDENEELDNNDENQADENIKTIDGNNQEDVDSEEDAENEGDDDDAESGDSSSNLYSSVAAVLHEQGLLPSLSIDLKDIKSVDDFVEAFKNEQIAQSRALAEEYLQNLDVESIARSKADINNLSNIEEGDLRSNIDQAKQIIYQDYLNQGLDQAKVDRLLSRLTDSGEDAIIEEAMDSIESLKEFNGRKIEHEKQAYEQRVKDQAVQQEKLDQEIKKNIFERKDLIKGYNLNKAIQDKVYKNMNEIVGKSPEGVFENKFMRDRRMNPVEFESRMYTIYELTNGFTDFSKISTTGKSSAVNDLEKIIKKGSYKDTGNPTWMNDKESYDIGIGDELNF